MCVYLNLQISVQKGSCSVQRCILGEWRAWKTAQKMLFPVVSDGSRNSGSQFNSPMTIFQLSYLQSTALCPEPRIISSFKHPETKEHQEIPAENCCSVIYIVHVSCYCLPWSPNQESRSAPHVQKSTFTEEITKDIKLSIRVSLNCPFLLMQEAQTLIKEAKTTPEPPMTLFLSPNSTLSLHQATVRLLLPPTNNENIFYQQQNFSPCLQFSGIKGNFPVMEQTSRTGK